MMFRKYMNYLKLRIAVSQYNQTSTDDKLTFKAVLQSISNIEDDSEVNGVIDAFNGIY